MLARLCVILCTIASAPALAATRTFSIDSNASRVHLHVGKTGIGSFAGHEHNIFAPALMGEVAADFEDLPKSTVEVLVNARAMTVSPEGEPDGDAPKVQQAMRASGVLNVARYPLIRFRSRNVTGKKVSASSYELQVEGELSLHGTVKPMVVPLKVDVQGDTLTADGKLTVKQSDFGIKPTTAAGGLVQVEDEVPIDFKIVAKASR
ncbi:MAG: YceI family protein [Myxococcales bacterium]